MSFDACAALVERGDPDRFLSALTAPRGGRGHLMALYAFNLEVVRAPWVTQEHMIAEMRLQWWADAIGEIFGGGAVRRHEVVDALAATIKEADLPRAPFDALIEARRADIYPDPPEDAAALWRYLEATAGGLMALAAQTLGPGVAGADVARTYGTGAGAASYLSAIPVLVAAGRRPLPEGVDVQAVARAARARLDAARKRRAEVPRPAAAAFNAGWLADDVLSGMERDADAYRPPSEFRRRAILLHRSLTGRW